MREDVVPAPEDSLDPETVALRRLLHDAGEATALPGPLDLARAVHSGRRRRRRRLAGQGLVGLAAAAVLVGLVTLPGGAPRPGPEPAAPSGTAKRSLGIPDPQASSSDLGQQLADVLADPSAVLSRVAFSDPQHASAVVSVCTGSCTAYALVTADGWRTWRAMPAGDGSDGIAQLPDGTALVASTGPAGTPLVHALRADGTAAPVQVLDSPGPAQGILLPPLLGKAAAGAATWTYDRASATLRPLTGAPTADVTYTAPVRMPDHSLVVLLGRGIPTASLTVARSTDEGRTWTTSTVRPHTAGSITVGGAAASPDGRLAVLFDTMADDVGPFAELQTSSDGGRTWSVTPSTGPRPRTATAVAFTGDGTLLLAEDVARRLWEQQPGGALTPATDAPAGQDLTGSAGGVVAASTGPRDVSWTSDGRHWQHWSLPTSVPDPAAVLVAQPAAAAPAASEAARASAAAQQASQDAASTPLVPSDGAAPAAGVCSTATGHTVTVALGPDGVTMPRCVHVHPDQVLTVRNDSNSMGQPGVRITVTWAPFALRTLAPGQETTYDRPFGSYLEVGHHVLPLGDGSRAELILDER